MKKGSSFERSLCDLPSEILWQILCRLPIKTCLTCKLVCKDWYHIIISPPFTDFRRRRISSLIVYGQLSNRRKNFMVMELDKASNNVVNLTKFKSEFKVPHYKLSVVNVCNGLVCLKSDLVWDCYYICNLLTSQCVTVKQEQPVRKPYRRLCGYGFGFCAVTQQYKVLRFLQSQNVREFVAEILTLGTDVWRSVDGAPTSSYCSGPFMKGALHWYCLSSKRICAFHFGTEQFQYFPLPNKILPIWRELLGFDSYLSLCCHSAHQTTAEVWVMREYGDKDSWVRQFVIRNGIQHHPRVPLLQMDNGNLLVCCNHDLAFYDPETRACSKVEANLVSICELQAWYPDFSLMPAGYIEGAETQGLKEDNHSVALPAPEPL